MSSRQRTPSHRSDQRQAHAAMSARVQIACAELQSAIEWSRTLIADSRRRVAASRRDPAGRRS